MKNIITFLFLMFLPVFALAQTEKLDAIFEKYQEIDDREDIFHINKN